MSGAYDRSEFTTGVLPDDSLASSRITDSQGGDFIGDFHKGALEWRLYLPEDLESEYDGSIPAEYDSIYITPVQSFAQACSEALAYARLYSNKASVENLRKRRLWQAVVDRGGDDKEAAARADRLPCSWASLTGRWVPAYGACMAHEAVVTGDDGETISTIVRVLRGVPEDEQMSLIKSIFPTREDWGRPACTAYKKIEWTTPLSSEIKDAMRNPKSEEAGKTLREKVKKCMKILAEGVVSAMVYSNAEKLNERLAAEDGLALVTMGIQDRLAKQCKAGMDEGWLNREGLTTSDGHGIPESYFVQVKIEGELYYDEAVVKLT